MTSNEDAEIRKHGYKPLKRRSPTPLYYPLRLLRVLEAHELPGLSLGECMRSNLAAQLP